MFIFFFVKQKTAYEMRISDWSSDVCSSDLHQTLDHQSTEAGGVDSGGNFVVEDASSRLGVRGVEDLGGGLSAIFAYEFGVNTDEVTTGNAGEAGARKSVV